MQGRRKKVKLRACRAEKIILQFPDQVGSSDYDLMVHRGQDAILGVLSNFLHSVCSETWEVSMDKE